MSLLAGARQIEPERALDRIDVVPGWGKALEGRAGAP
jgi:hypothetical protein